MIAADATWLVTGGSAGFGREIVRAALARGARVVATARNPDHATDLVALAPDRVATAALDLTRPETIAPALAMARARFGAIDVLVNNAGYGLMATVEEAGDHAVRRLFETNLFGPAALIRAVLPEMRRRRSGLVINVSSTAGSRGLPGSGYYSASKSGLEMLTEALALEVADLGIRAMIVAPGPFRTDFFRRSIDTADAGLADYAAIRTQREAWLALDGAQRGDPARGAAMIIEAALSADPPPPPAAGRAGSGLGRRGLSRPAGPDRTLRGDRAARRLSRRRIRA
jgi:NAD(P)-dependent dehydrogenase (short-subunit alcohol dehydrogenase family)